MSNVSNDLIGHSLTHCTDPDCEIHCPWVDENHPEYACALFIAGMLRGFDYVSAQVDDAWQGARDNLAQLRTVENIDEALA